ncbi:MAG TPA: PKD domain-containing protein [Bacteroidia bacterium]|nr:PKD domain-containing protein [Bacteroidia bacterium]
MKFLTVFLFLICTVAAVRAQDDCANATALCGGSSVSSTTIGATTVASDPALPCGDGVVQRSMWFTILGINNGTAIITLTNIDSAAGLSISAYTGSCGSLVPIAGACDTGFGPAGSATISFATTPGTVYYIMVDGEAGNPEQFTITATTPDDGIIARPSTSFNANPIVACVPACITLQNTTIPHGTPVTYSWRLCTTCPYLPASGADTTVCYDSIGTYEISLRASNACGTTIFTQEITIQDLFPAINYSPVTTCVGQPVSFTGSASVLPDPPFTNPNIVNWSWDFGDPLSGPSNTSNLQNPTHIFVGIPPFTVTLIVDGACGPDTTTIVVNLLPPPVVTAASPSPVCQGTAVSLTSTDSNATAPVSYQWSGPGTIACPTCQNTSVSGLPPGGPYVFTITITDANGCTATDTTSVVITPLPIANAGNDTTVCRYSSVQLNGSASSGTPPYTYAWTPGTGLSDSTIANPTTIVSANVTYCLVVTDSLGCVSTPDCVDLNVFPPPTLNSPPSVLCATDPNPLTSTFTVTGAGAGSTYEWYLSADYSYITSSNVDSSSVTATYPSGVPATYNFTVIVTDGVTGCVDTLSTSFTIQPGLTMGINGPFTICAGQSVTITATGATTYAWTASPAYAFADSTLASQNVSPTATTTFTVLGTTGTCTQQLTATVNVNPLPVAVASPIPPFCGCDTVSLNGTGSTPGMVYLWTSAGGNPIGSPSSLVTSAIICTSDVFTLVVTDTSTGCSDSVSVSANATTNPAAVASVLPNIICDGVATVVTLDGTGSDTNPGTTYLWTSAPPVPIANDTLLITTATVTTTTVFTLTVAAASGCDSTVTATVNVYPPPTLTGNPGALCTTDPLLQAILTITGAGAGSTYEWYLSPDYIYITSSNLDSSSVTTTYPPVVGNYTFIVIVTDGVTGCVDTLSTTIPIVAGVVLTTSGNQTICEGDALTLTANGALSYQWSNGDTTSSTVVSPPLPASGSPYQFIVIGTTGSCSDTDTVVVTVNPVPVTSSINGAASVCENVLGQMYTTSGSAGSTFTWTVTGGTIASGQGNDTIFVDWGSAGGGTVTVVETNSFGCAGAPVVLNVTINPLPNTSVITGPDTVCAGSSANYSVTNVAGSTYAWTVIGGLPLTGTGSNINVTWGAPGSGTITVVETNAVGCSDTAVILNVVINPVPITPPITGPTLVCEGTLGSVYSVPPTAGSTYNWSVAGNGNITFGQGTNSVTIDWGLPGTATITVVEVNSSGCPGAPQTLTVTINGTPTASATAVQDTVCLGGNVQLNGTATNGTILWTTSGNGTFSNPTSASPTYTTGSADVPFVTLTMTVSNPPCPDAIATVQITVIPLPVTSVISGPDTVCEGSSAVYSVTNNAGSVYSWTVTGGTIASGNGSNQITVNWGAAGSGTVSVTEYNFFGCMGSTSILNVTINPSPVAITIAGTDTLCQNEFGQYIASPATAGSIYTWVVSSGVPGAQGNDTMDIQWTTPGNQTVIVTEMNAFGCIGVSDTFNVVVHPLPAPLILTGPDTVCEYDVSVYYVGNTPGSTYNWIVTGGLFTQNGDTITVTWGFGSGGSITVSETDSFGCTGSALITNIVINPRPNTTLSGGSTLVCEGDTGVTYGVNPTAGSYYLWTINNGTITSPNDSSNSVTVTWGAPPSGSLTIVEVSANGCTGLPVSYNVFINPKPVATATPTDTVICVSQPIQLYGDASTANLSWFTSGSGIFSDLNNDTTIYTPSPADTGIIILYMVVANAPCPNDTAFVTLTIVPLPIVTITSDTTICFGDSATLTAAGGVTYLWTPGNDTTSSIIVSPALTTIYFVTVTNATGCSASDSVRVFVNPWGVAIAGNDTAICNIDSLVLNGITQNAGGGIWTTLGDGTFIPNAQTLNATYIPGAADIAAGTVTLILTTTGNICTNQSDTIIVAVNSFLSVYAGPDQTVNRGATATIAGTVTGAGGGWWTTTGSGTFTPDSFSLNAVYHPSQTDYNSGFIYLVLHSANACNAATDTLILLFPDFVIPNVFTPRPNSPGYNDYFVIEGLPANSALEIFNRWGMLVFKADKYLNNWDAAEVNDDTYYYILNTPDKKSYHGFVRVIKKE